MAENLIIMYMKMENLKNSETIKARLKETKILNGLTKNLERQRKILM